MTELKPCPFCGSHDVEYYETGDYGFPFNYVCCRDCPASVRESSEQDAITAWNTRTDDKHLGQLKNLLAIIHRDGGHYVAEHGLEKATEDAIKIIPDCCPKKNSMDGWISVEDRLPEELGSYLVWCDSVTSKMYPNICSKVDVLYWGFGGWEDAKVKFWMPLPKSPNTGKE